MTNALIIYPHDDSQPDRPRVSIVPLDKVWKRAGEIVGGYIELCYLTVDDENGYHLAAMVNENGIAEGLRPAAEVNDGPILFGPIVIVRERIDEEGETHYADLTPMDVWTVNSLVAVLTPVATVETLDQKEEAN